MKMITAFIRKGRQGVLHLGVLFAAGLILAGCSVSGPDESAWQNVADYSWPTATGTLLRYRVETKIDTVCTTATTESSDSLYHGRSMYRLDDPSMSSRIQLLYLPLKDTLVVRFEEFGGKYLLVGPLEKGHTWISGYSDDAETKPSWQATVIDRYSHLQLEGKYYDNVVVVQYKPLAASRQGEYWIRFYAQGAGPIQTIQHYPLAPDSLRNGPPVSIEELTTKRTVLVETTSAQD
jgi:hypothetical protein